MNKELVWRIKPIKLDLKYNWKLSRNETIEKTNLIIEIEENGLLYLGEVAPNIRYNETPELIVTQFDNLLSNGLTTVSNIDTYQQFINQFKICNSLRFGLETAIMSYHHRKISDSFYNTYKLEKPKNVPISYTIPILEPSDIEHFIADNKSNRFKYLKLKINSDMALDIIKETSKYTDKVLLVDANEGYNDVDQLINFMSKLNKFNIKLVEQPMPSHCVEDYIYLKKHSPYPIFADESMIDQTDLTSVALQFDGINIKLMKTGGIVKALQIYKEAKNYKLQTMIGCMVETSIGISNALKISTLFDYCDLDGSLLIKNEPFNLINEQQGLLNFN